MPESPDHLILGNILAHLRKANPALCRQWFYELECLGVVAGVLYVRAETEIQRRYLLAECLDAFRDAAQGVSGWLLTVEFLAPNENPPAPHLDRSVSAVARAPVVVRRRVERDEFVLDPEHTFDTFVDGPTSQLAHAAAQAVADQPGAAYNPLFIHGDVGLGKTHLVHAICHRRLALDPCERLVYLGCQAFIARYTEAMRRGTIREFNEQFRDASMLLIDDVHFLSKLDKSQQEFFHTFNTLHQLGRQIVLTSDAPPDEIPDLEERLVSRFACGLVTKISPPEYETRVQIVSNEAFRRGVTLPQKVAGLIASHYTRNIRELEGALTKVMLYADHIAKGPITYDVTMAALDIDHAATRPRVGVQDIIVTVSEYYGVPAPQVLSRRRTRSIALPRHVGMYLARRMTRHSLEEIGGYFGGRDHSTVLHAINNIERLRKIDDGLDGAVGDIERTLRESALRPA